MDKNVDTHKFYDVNLIEYFPIINKESKRSSFLLSLISSHITYHLELKNLIDRIHSFCDYYKTLWGIKYEKGEISFEFYFYYPHLYEKHKFETITQVISPYLKNTLQGDELKMDYGCLSFNFDGGKIEGVNVYVSDKYDSLEINNQSYFIQHRQKPILINNYYSLLKEKGFHDDGFHFRDSSEKILPIAQKLFPDEDLSLIHFYKEYNYLKSNTDSIFPMGVVDKNDAIGLYFMSLSIVQFIEFLTVHKYPNLFIDEIISNQNNLNHIRYDIGIDFYIKDNKVCIKKTAFFGTI